MSPDRIKQLERTLMAVAENIASMSLATRSKVGALIYKDDKIISIGWNGMPSGMPNELLETVQPDGTLATNPLVMHAESNCITKCANTGSSTRDATLVVTMSPCRECAKLIIQCGIKRVIFKEQYRDSSGIQLLTETGVIVDHQQESVNEAS